MSDLVRCIQSYGPRNKYTWKHMRLHYFGKSSFSFNRKHLPGLLLYVRRQLACYCHHLLIESDMSTWWLDSDMYTCILACTLWLAIWCTSSTELNEKEEENLTKKMCLIFIWGLMLVTDLDMHTLIHLRNDCSKLIEYNYILVSTEDIFDLD